MTRFVNNALTANAVRSFAFGPFRLLPERQLLLRGEEAVRVGGRALDLLTALVERPGDVVTKSELIAHVWPDTTVDDSNLKVNMAALRRVLDEGSKAPQYIATVVGRGYRFIAPVEVTRPVDLPVEPVRRNVEQRRPDLVMGTSGAGETRVAGAALVAIGLHILAEAAGVGIVVTGHEPPPTARSASENTARWSRRSRSFRTRLLPRYRSQIG